MLGFDLSTKSKFVMMSRFPNLLIISHSLAFLCSIIHLPLIKLIANELIASHWKDQNVLVRSRSAALIQL